MVLFRGQIKDTLGDDMAGSYYSTYVERTLELRKNDNMDDDNEVSVIFLNGQVCITIKTVSQRDTFSILFIMLKYCSFSSYANFMC